jgi:hypothetical protein
VTATARPFGLSDQEAGLAKAPPSPPPPPPPMNRRLVREPRCIVVLGRLGVVVRGREGMAKEASPQGPNATALGSVLSASRLVGAEKPIQFVVL